MTDVAANSQAIDWPELELHPAVSARVMKGQKFNAYDCTSGGYFVGIGPITNLLSLTHVRDAETANLLVAALRIATGQPPVAAPVQPYIPEDEL